MLLADPTNYNLNRVRIFGSQLNFNRNSVYQSIKSSNRKWEWVYKSLFSSKQWNILKSALASAGVYNDTSSYDDEPYFEDFDESVSTDSWMKQIESLEEEWYKEDKEDNYNDEGITIEDFDINSFTGELNLSDQQIKQINKIIGNLFKKSNKGFARNENGLLMLSKKLFPDVHADVFYDFYRVKFTELSACIYTGDMCFNVKSCPTIYDFLKMVKERLLMFQIPHHGASHNSSYADLHVLPTEIFFWHDKNNLRLVKSGALKSLSPSFKLFLVDTVSPVVCGIYL